MTRAGERCWPASSFCGPRSDSAASRCSNVENACASASTALPPRLAGRREAGCMTIVLSGRGRGRLTPPGQRRGRFAAIGRVGRRSRTRRLADLPAGRSFLMDMYAESALRYLEQARGATRGRPRPGSWSRTQRHGMLNPGRAVRRRAHRGGGAGRPGGSLWPFTLQMCSPISDRAPPAGRCWSAASRALGPRPGSPGSGVCGRGSALPVDGATRA